MIFQCWFFNHIQSMLCISRVFNYYKDKTEKGTISMKMYIHLVLGDAQRRDGNNVSAGASFTQQVESRTGMGDDSPVSTPHQMPCSSTPSSSTQAKSVASQPSCSSEVLLSAKECQDLIGEFFGADKVVHSYYTCPSKLCSSLREEEIARLKQQKKKYIHTWHQEKENWWLCFVESEGMFCLLCKKHAVKTVQNKEESAFIQTASTRLKYDVIKGHRDSDRHRKAVSQELLQRVSQLKYFNHRSEGSIREIFLNLGETIKEQIVTSVQKVQSYGLMVDEVTDISVQSQMLTFIQFVSPVTSSVEIAFLSVQNVLDEFSSANADALTSLIKDELVQQCGLSLKNLKSLATDGAAVMIGKNNGVAAQLKELNPVIINVHCICHKLALACTDTNKEIAYIKRVEDTLRQLWTYFENSPKRLAVLLKMQINIKKCSLQLKEKSKQILVKRMKKACSTRWLSFDKSVAALYQEYEAVLHTLQALDEGGCATAHGLLNRPKEGKFVGVLFILKDVLPILSNLSKAFQGGSVAFSQIVPLINATKASLEELLETNSPVQKFLAALDSYTNICEDLKLSTVQQQQLHRLQEQYVTSMVGNIEARFANSSPILAALKIFYPLAVPESNEFGFNVYGNRDISSLAQHFYQGDDDASQKTRSSKLLAEWHQMKFNINDNIKPNIPIEIKTGKSSTTSTQWFLSQLMKAKSEYQPFFGELLLIAEAAITLPVSNAWPERGASALKIVKNRCRSRLQNDMLEAMLHVKNNGPALGSPKMASLVTQAVQSWLDKKNRKKLPSRQGPLHTATEAPLPVNSPKEVADVSVQTDVVEENAIQEIEHEVEEVSTLLDISPVLPDSDDYDSAFESDTDS